MKNAIQTVAATVPPYVLFLFGFASAFVLGLVKLHNTLQGLGQ